MPDFPTSNIALQVQQPNAMTGIGQMLNMAATAQQMKSTGVGIERSQTELQQQRMDLEERQNLRQLATKLGDFKNDDGSFNFDNLTNAATKVAPKLGMDWAKGITTTLTEGQHAKQAINATDEQTRKQAGGLLLGLADSPPDVQVAVINAAVDQYPQLTPAFRFLLNRVLPKASSPEASKKAMIGAAKMVMSPEEQKSLGTPSGPAFNTGQVSGTINTNPFAGDTGPVAGTQTQNVIPPTSLEFDPASKTFRYVGTRPQGGAPQAQPPLGQEATVVGTVGVANKDWQDTVSKASNAAQDVGVLQEIKKYAPDAITGVGGNARQLSEGFSGWVLSQFPGAEKNWLQENKTNTDLLAKNSNMLALAGGDTNLARTMAEAMNPNTHMTPQAIAKAADQVIAQRQLALARQQYLGKFRNDHEAYTKAMNDFNQVADPRILQVATMSDAELKKMKAAMSPTERKDFGDKIRKMYEMGLIR